MVSTTELRDFVQEMIKKLAFLVDISNKHTEQDIYIRDDNDIYRIICEERWLTLMCKNNGSLNGVLRIKTLDRESKRDFICVNINARKCIAIINDLNTFKMSLKNKPPTYYRKDIKYIPVYLINNEIELINIYHNDPHHQYKNNTVCSICLNKVLSICETNMITTTCKHSFHVYCMERWLINDIQTCPTCNRILVIRYPLC